MLDCEVVSSVTQQIWPPALVRAAASLSKRMSACPSPALLINLCRFMSVCHTRNSLSLQLVCTHLSIELLRVIWIGGAAHARAHTGSVMKVILQFCKENNLTQSFQALSQECQARSRCSSLERALGVFLTAQLFSSCWAGLKCRRTAYTRVCRCLSTPWTASKRLLLISRMGVGTSCCPRHASAALITYNLPLISRMLAANVHSSRSHLLLGVRSYVWDRALLAAARYAWCQVAQLKLPRRKLEDLYEQIILVRHPFPALLCNSILTLPPGCRLHVAAAAMRLQRHVSDPGTPVQCRCWKGILMHGHTLCAGDG